MYIKVHMNLVFSEFSCLISNLFTQISAHLQPLAQNTADVRPKVPPPSVKIIGGDVVNIKQVPYQVIIIT